ncbi:MAG: hypothetical protein WKG07_01205 [Hymenobacter sp.]
MGIQELEEGREKGWIAVAKPFGIIDFGNGLWLLGKYGDDQVRINNRNTGSISFVLTKIDS